MESLIEIEKLISQAKKAGANMGKGDPYNRLRYYTKIGWLPHMTRRKDNQGKLKGHYPSWVLERLIQIEKLKDQGLNNDQITQKIGTRNKALSLYAKINTQEFRNRVISYSSLLLLVVILLVEIDVLNVSKQSNPLPLQTPENVPTQLTGSGVSFVPANKKVIFVKNDSLDFNSKVYVTFNQNFSPATRYWVSEVEPGRGFYVELDAPVFDNVEFSWWTSN